MKIDLSYLLFTALIPTASSIWVIVPPHAFKCGDITVTSQQLANYVESGCEHRYHAKKSRFSRFKPIHGPLSPRPYKGHKFAANNPLFEIGVRENWRQAVFSKQPFKAVFEWDNKEEVCIPYGIVFKGKSGKEERCRELRFPYHDSFKSHSEISDDPSLNHAKGVSPSGSPRGAEKPKPDPKYQASPPRKFPFDRFAGAQPLRKLRGFFRKTPSEATQEDRSSGHRRAQSMEEKTGSAHKSASSVSSEEDIILEPGFERHYRSKSFTEGSNKDRGPDEWMSPPASK